MYIQDERIFEDMNESYTIKDIITLLLNHITLIVICAVLGAAAGYSLSKYVLPMKYASHITMYVQSYTDITENEDNIKTSVTPNNLSTPILKF